MDNRNRIFRHNVVRLVVAVVTIGTLSGVAVNAATAAVVPPSVTTGAVSSVTPTTAVVNGTVDPHGSSTSWYVEYGTTTAYGSKSTVASTGAGGTISVSQKISGLVPEATYHYAIVATNAGGTVTGGDGLLSTLGTPVATTGVVNELGATELRFTGVVQPNGQHTDYYFEFGPTTTYGTRTTAASAGSGGEAIAVEYLVPNLKPSTTYHYRLVAYSAGAKVYGHDASASTAADISLSSAVTTITYGATDVISGVVADHTAGETVGVLAEPSGAAGFAGIGTTTTAAGGAWNFTVRPTILTEYEVGVAGGDSPPIAVSVRPAVKLAAVAGSSFATRITASVTFAGRVAQLQRLQHNTWTLVRHFALGPRGSATIPGSWLPRGRSDLRIAIGVDVAGPNQAGFGYLAGTSNSVTFER